MSDFLMVEFVKVSPQTERYGSCNSHKRGDFLQSVKPCRAFQFLLPTAIPSGLQMSSNVQDSKPSQTFAISPEMSLTRQSEQ